ncbi:SWI/SNF complex subunit SWI3B [Quillaja saponaria]|uniref:SWI/SNF complex subunit SWI3B n=1 Tax=Quillaja saponaria TaxID=32244 RepID=A0AAD7LZ96_QUISA|nr:SWI/SNF complex subunit SWI3B [Quillaja saponaria]
MATKSPAGEPPSSFAVTPTSKLQPPPFVKPETPFSDSRDSPATVSATLRPPDPPSISDANIIHVPSHSRWFSWDHIHECEVRFLPEFLDYGSPSKNPRIYKYYRNSIVKLFRYNPSRKITFTDVRKTLVGDVGSIRRVFDFLESWGLINYQPASALSKPLKWEDKESKSSGSAEAGGNSIESATPNRETSGRVCSGCKTICTIACFACDKYDLTLCARCYVRGNYRVGVSSSDFRRVEISEQTKIDWTDKDTLQLLEGIMYYGDDWRRISQHVGGRSEKECVAHFIKLPFGEEFLGYPDSGVHDNKQLKDHSVAKCGSEIIGTSTQSKRMCLSPLADASNPIMAQAAFLSAFASVEVVQAAAQAAVTTLSEVNRTSRASYRSLSKNTIVQEADIDSNSGNPVDAFEGACLDANSHLEQEALDVEKAVTAVIEVQMEEIQDKLVGFEELDLEMEKEWQQLEQMKNMLFVDQLTLQFHGRSASKTGELSKEINVKTD